MAHAPTNTRKKSSDTVIHKFQGKESYLTSQIEIYVEEEKPKIPDGGWGWMIVLAAFVLNTISEGVSFSFGLMYIEFLVEFGASKSATSWIGSLFLALPLLTGPLGSALVDRYGCITMTCLGSLICTSGFIMSAYARSIGVMYVTFGIIGGVGRCLTFVTAVVSIAFWFEKRRTVALGLAASGAGFGTIVFAPLTTALLVEYRWRGTMLILAGFFFNMCVCGVMMKDPAWIVAEEREKKANKKQVKRGPIVNGDPSKLNEIKRSLKQGNDTHVLLQNVNTAAELSDKKRFRSNVDLPTYLKENEKVPIEVLKRMSTNRLYKIFLENVPSLPKAKSLSEKDLSASDANSCKLPLKFSVKLKKPEEPILEADENEEGCKRITKATPLIRRSSSEKSRLPRNHSNTYLANLRMRKTSTSASKPNIFNINKYKVGTASCPDVYGNVLTIDSEEESWYVEFFKSLKNLINLSLFLELHFFLLSISTIILFVWFIVPYFYLAEHMTRIGYTDVDASYALSVIGITNTVGMVFLGWAGDRLNIAKTYAICLILCGISVAFIMFFARNFWFLMFNSGLFGLFFASCFSLLPSLLAELVPLEEFTMAYGLVLLCEGVGNLIGPPLAGLLFDFTGSWDQSFYQAAFWIIICGLLVGIIPYTTNRKMIGSGPILIEKHKSQNSPA